MSDEWLTANPPDLQALVEHAGRRYAASIGEDYVEDPFKRPPHHGGNPHITPEDWAAYDQAMADSQARRTSDLVLRQRKARTETTTPRPNLRAV
jgi:hypothetical protein